MRLLVKTLVNVTPRFATLAAFVTIGCGARTELAELMGQGAGGDAPVTAGLCGNGNVEASEQCDDGNSVGGDGCSADCTWEALAIACGHMFNCALGANGVIKCWGLNHDGSLGLGTSDNRGDQVNELGGRLPAVDLGAGARVLSISAGAAACALLQDGTVRCWGRNESGELGLGDDNDRGDAPNEMGDQLPKVELGTGLRVDAIASGSERNCAVSSGGRVKCWGVNRYGELGLGDVLTRGDQPGQMGDALPFVDLGRARTARAVTIGQEFVCALLDDASVKCWGNNSYGQLGQGDRNARGDQPGEMGDALAAVDLGTGRSARAIAASGGHVCALLDDSSVKCWGFNWQGQLGVGDVQHRGDDLGEMGDALPRANLGSGRKPVELAGGSDYTCVRFDDGAVKCWGSDDFGQLGLGETNSRISRGNLPEDMGDNLPTLDLGTGRYARSICAGYQTNCALLDNGQVKCWGSNHIGQLGLGNTGMGALMTHGAEPGQMGDNLPPVDLRF